MLTYITFQVCVFEDGLRPPKGIVFLSNIVPSGLVTIVAHVCDKLTYEYVRTHTFSRSADGKIIKPEDSQHLKIPMNAVRASMLSFGPIVMIIILRYMMKNFSGFARTEMFVTLI